MSIDERSLSSEEQSNIQALTLTQASTLSQPVGSLARYSQDVAIQSGAAPEIKTYFHAFRRNWLLAMALGVCFGTAAGLVVWFLMGDRYTAEAYIQLHYKVENMVFNQNNLPVESEYELFKNTQMQYVSSNFVLDAALHKPEDNPISRLPILKGQKDPVEWLKKKLTNGGVFVCDSKTFAREIGISESMSSLVLSGNRSLSQKYWERVAKLLDISDWRELKFIKKGE